MNRQYNGWTNYETWLVALWMDNDSYNYDYWRTKAKYISSEFNSPTDIEAISLLATLLKEFVEEDMPETTGLYADLMNSALSEVDWHEIAEHYLAEVDE